MKLAEHIEQLKLPAFFIQMKKRRAGHVGLSVKGDSNKRVKPRGESQADELLERHPSDFRILLFDNGRGQQSGITRRGGRVIFARRVSPAHVGHFFERGQRTVSERELNRIEQTAGWRL